MTTALAYIGWAIEKHLDEIPTKLKPTFQEILNDAKARKEYFWEDHKTELFQSVIFPPVIFHAVMFDWA